jgi:hypothetical protein
MRNSIVEQSNSSGPYYPLRAHGVSREARNQDFFKKNFPFYSSKPAFFAVYKG